jgi:hypothetical protein
MRRKQQQPEVCTIQKQRGIKMPKKTSNVKEVACFNAKKFVAGMKEGMRKVFNRKHFSVKRSKTDKTASRTSWTLGETSKLVLTRMTRNTIG